MAYKKDGKLVSDYLRFNQDLASKGRLKYKGRPGYSQMGISASLAPGAKPKKESTDTIDKETGFKKQEQQDEEKKPADRKEQS